MPITLVAYLITVKGDRAAITRTYVVFSRHIKLFVILSLATTVSSFVANYSFYLAFKAGVNQGIVTSVFSSSAMIGVI